MVPIKISCHLSRHNILLHGNSVVEMISLKISGPFLPELIHMHYMVPLQYGQVIIGGYSNDFSTASKTTLRYVYNVQRLRFLSCTCKVIFTGDICIQHFLVMSVLASASNSIGNFGMQVQIPAWFTTNSCDFYNLSVVVM